MNPVDALILDFLPPKLWGNKLLFFIALNLWDYVAAALADAYTKADNGAYLIL